MARIHYYTFHYNADAPSTGTEFHIDSIENPDNLGLEITGTATSCLIVFQAQKQQLEAQILDLNAKIEAIQNLQK